MIDIEKELFTTVKNSLPNNVCCGATYSSQTSKFPYVTLESFDNSVYEGCIDSARIENAANISIEVNVYSNKTNGKKEECRKLIHKIDDVLSGLGLTRVSCSPTPNLEDATIYRMTSRYKAIVDLNKNIYRR